jgi:hypothetical protein
MHMGHLNVGSFGGGGGGGGAGAGAGAGITLCTFSLIELLATSKLIQRSLLTTVSFVDTLLLLL